MIKTATETLPKMPEKKIRETDCVKEYEEIEKEFKTIFNIDKINGKISIDYFLFRASRIRIKDTGQWQVKNYCQPLLLKFKSWYINHAINNEITVAICELVIPFQDIVKPADEITVELRYLRDQKIYEIFAHAWNPDKGSNASEETYYGYVTKVL